MAITKIQSESLNLADTYDFTGTVTGAGGVNTPYFQTYLGSTHTISDDTFTKINFDTVTFDTNSNYSTANKRYTPTVAGKYFIYFHFQVESWGVRRIEYAQCRLYKNGSNIKGVTPVYSADNISWVSTGVVTAIIDMNGSSDYLEVYARIHDVGGTSPKINGGNATVSSFGGYRIIE